MNQSIILLIFAVALAITACREVPLEEINKETHLEQEGRSICSAVSEIPLSECQALVSFYHSTGGPKWTLNRGWLETEQPCSWSGLKCADGHVTAITLNYNELRGSLPPELGQLGCKHSPFTSTTWRGLSRRSWGSYLIYSFLFCITID